MQSKSTQLIKNPRAIVEAPHEPVPDHVHEPAPHAPIQPPANPHPHDEVDDLKPLEGEGIETGATQKPTEPGVLRHLEPLKRLAKKSLPLLQHLVALRGAYVNDPQLNSKEAKTEMAAIMSLLFREDEAAVYFFGQVLFEPNVGSFITLFDDIGPEKLGPYLGINNIDQIPGGGKPAAGGDEGIAGVGAAPHPAAAEPAPPGPIPAPGAPPAPANGAHNLPRL